MGNSFHVVCLVAMDLWLIDNASLEELAQAAARLRTGSPVNPIAVF